MKRLRTQVDQIDLKILQLLQQRTKLSGKIGQAKRRYHGVIYVPERERDLVARVTQLNKGKLPAKALTAIFREIISSSRAAQGQAPVGLLKSGAAEVLLPGRWCLGACDEFVTKRTWSELAKGLENGSLALALLTGADLLQALRSPAMAGDFQKRLTVAGDFSSVPDSPVPLQDRIFIVTPRGPGATSPVNRMAILIKCKSTVNAVKTLRNCMSNRSTHAEQLSLQAQSGTQTGLLRVTLSRPLQAERAVAEVTSAAQTAGLLLTVLGVYSNSEDYGG